MNLLARRLTAAHQLDQPTYVPESNAQSLRAAYQSEVGQSILAIHAMTIGKAVWSWQDPPSFIITHCRGAQPGAPGKLTDSQRLILNHGSTCKLGSKEVQYENYQVHTLSTLP
jgi:hypothetical protein